MFNFNFLRNTLKPVFMTLHILDDCEHGTCLLLKHFHVSSSNKIDDQATNRSNMMNN